MQLLIGRMTPLIPQKILKVGIQLTPESLSEKNSDASSEALTIDSSVIDNEMDEQQKIDLAIKNSYSEGYGEKGFSEGVEKEEPN